MRKSGFVQYVKAHPLLYLMLLPGLVYVLIFNYAPMYGVVIAFQKFNIVKGILGSEWIGLQNFRELFNSIQFRRVFTNSISISVLRILWGFPAPILLALLLNEVRSMRFKRAVQTIVYVPHFVSWVVVASLVINLLSPTSGAVNALLGMFGVAPHNYLIDTRYFRTILISAELWKEVGWGTIIYMAALAQIDQQIYEAATIDGAGRWQMIFRVTLPCLSSTIAIMLILRLGSILNNGFEQIFLLYRPLTYEVADVFETYTYRVGLLEGRFSYSTAVGLFQSVVGCIMIFTTNQICRKLGETSLF